MKNVLKFLTLVFIVGFSLMIFTSHTFASERTSNKYILKFQEEKDENKITVNSIEEEIILESLQSYWELDLKVVDILTGKSEDLFLKDIVLSTNEGDKIKSIKIIENIYDDVSEEEKLLLYDYVVRYARGKEDEEVLKFLSILDAEYEERHYLNAVYKGDAAANWAFDNYNVYRTSYPKFTGSFGTNCTNFVSQAMHIGGGLPKQGRWTISRKNTKYHVINSAAQLDYSWTLTNPSPWISVSEFTKFWRSKSSVRGASKSQYLHFTHNYRNQKRGDIVILSKGVAGFATIPTHAMIITQITSSDYNLAGNSVERQKHSLKTAIQSYSYVEFYTPK